MSYVLSIRFFVMATEPETPPVEGLPAGRVRPATTRAPLTTWNGGFGFPTELHPAYEFRPKERVHRGDPLQLPAAAAEYAEEVLLACNHGTGSTATTYAPVELPDGHCVGADSTWSAGDTCRNFLIRRSVDGAMDLVFLPSVEIGDEMYDFYFGVGLNWRQLP